MPISIDDEQFIKDIDQFVKKRVKGEQKNFKVSKKFLVDNYPDVFEIKKSKKDFIIKDYDKAKEILLEFYIPNMENLSVKTYTNKAGYTIKNIYQKRKPRPYNIIKEVFSGTPCIQKFLEEHKDDKPKVKINYLMDFVPNDLKKMESYKLYQVLYKYINN